MSSETQAHNLIRGTRDWSGTWGRTEKWAYDGTYMGFPVRTIRGAWDGLRKPVRLVAGHTYTFSALVRCERGSTSTVYIFLNGDSSMSDAPLANGEVKNATTATFLGLGDGEWHTITRTFTVTASKDAAPRFEQDASGKALSVCAYMLVEGTTPAAWAPAEGEELAGGGALMSANLWNASAATIKPDADGVYLSGKAGDLHCAITGTSALAENQTVHMGASLRGTDAGYIAPYVGYMDAAGKKNWTGFPHWTPSAEWQRFEATYVVPSGMTIYEVDFNTSKSTGNIEVSNPVFSYGSPVPLASSAHTPYATQDHVAAEYATKASLKVTDDRVTSEVTERGKLAGRVGTLESTSGTHTSRLEQLAASIKSLVKGESTYTDPDGASATSGIYSLVTQTRDSVTALFGQYTKTADLASTQAVKDAKKAGTDAQAAASAASSTASSAKSTADSLATMIRADSTGITVGKSADGETWSTGRTHMTADSFDVLDKAGNVLSSFGKNLIELGKNSMDATISMLAGLVKIQARNDGSNTVASVSSGFLSFDSLWRAIMRAGKETGGAYVEGYAAAIAEVTGRRGSARLYCTQGNGSRITANNSFTVLPDGYDLGRPEYLAAALLGTGGGGTGITHSQDAVTMTPDLDTCGPGVFSYSESTANRPTDYGTCVCIRAGDGTDTGTWLFQLALPTTGDPLWRRNINGAGWSSWWTITSQ